MATPPNDINRAAYGWFLFQLAVNLAWPILKGRAFLARIRIPH